MPKDLKPSDTRAIEKVRSLKCPECDGPMVPRQDTDGMTVRALACPRHGEFTTPQGRSRVREARARRGVDLDQG